MTGQRGSRPGADVGQRRDAEVVSIAAHGLRSQVAAQIAAAREYLGMTAAEYADHLTAAVGWMVRPESVESWERGTNPPGDVLWFSMKIVGGVPDTDTAVLDPVPAGFPADALTGAWVTAYQFTHRGIPHFHADIAHVTADGGRRVRAVNHPPEPRTQGRSAPFRNEIEGLLFGRHLVGSWRNTSDTRYFGALQLAVMPGETVMDGHYTGLASDIEVSTAHWRWVRLVSGDFADVRLREPAEVYALVMNQTPDDPPLTATDIREDD